MKKLFFVSLFCAIFLASCTTFSARNLSYGKVDGYDSNANRYFFREKVWANKFLGTSGGSTVFNISQSKYDYLISDVCTKAMKRFNGVGVDGITVEHSASLSCILLNTITCGIYAPSEIIVSGYVIVPKISRDKAVTTITQTVN